MTVTIDGTSGITTPMYNGAVASNQVTPVTAFKNRIINGAMVIDQRNAGASVTPTVNPTYVLDRWRVSVSQASKISVQQNAGSVTPPAGFSNYLGITSLAATSTSSDYYYLGQFIEGFNIADLAWGTANAKTVTLSFQVYSSLTGTFGGSLFNNGGSRSYPFTYTISSANTWTTISIVIAGDTSGTWLTNNGIGVSVNFGLGVSSTFSGTAGTWASAAYFSATGATSVVGTNGATFYITGVQLEVGSSATSFDYRPYGTELVLCQRYCQALNSSTSVGSYMRYGNGEAPTTTSFNTYINTPVQMRIYPSVTTTGTASNYSAYSAGTLTALNAVPAVSTDGNSPYQIVLNSTVASGLTAGRAVQLTSNNNQTSYLIFSAEL